MNVSPNTSASLLVLTGDASAKSYANSGACRRAARAALGAEATRGTEFEMRCREDGRWEWFELTVTREALRTGDNNPLTSEEWLREAVYRLYDTVFTPVLETKAALPAFRISRSWPGGGSARKRVGECWSSVNSDDGVNEMFISPLLGAEKATRVLGVTAHEMVHMLVGVEHGHKAPFAHLAKAIGLTGKMSATTESPEFIEAVQPLLDDMPAYPAARMNLVDKKVQKTYLLKVECTPCEVKLRMTQKVVDKCEATNGTGPMCPSCGELATVEIPEETEE